MKKTLGDVYIEEKLDTLADILTEAKAVTLSHTMAMWWLSK